MNKGGTLEDSIRAQPSAGSAQRVLSPALAHTSEGSGPRGLSLQQKHHLRQQHPLRVFRSQARQVQGCSGGPRLCAQAFLYSKPSRQSRQASSHSQCHGQFRGGREGEKVLMLRAIWKKEIAHHPTTQGEGGCKGAAEHSRIQHHAFARRSAGERERGRQGQREGGSLKSAWQGFHVADGFEYICLSGLHWSACAAIFEKLRCWHL